ncbi:MAG: alpha/beta hydrolase [Candidatus Eremiobacteraeota bacterium]|nr:alpha/beta hydrolase [Candidatus Eremiobacteraeota bacterium]
MKYLFTFAFLTISAFGYITPAAAATPAANYNVGTIHVDRYGDRKPALILIPGLSSGAWAWDSVIAKFAPSYTIYALTLAGFDGQPSATAPLMPKVEADLVRLITEKHIDKPVIIGHSLGGTLAINFAEQHSNLLRAVIAVDGLPVFPGFENMTSAQRAAAGSGMAAQMSGATHDQFLAAMKNFVMPSMITDKAASDRASILSAKSDPKASAEYIQEDINSDTRTDLNKIGVPLLEIAPFDATIDSRAPESLANSAAKQTYYAGLLKNDPTAKVEIIAPSRHFLMIDQPQRLNAAIAAFLQSIP